MKRILFSLLAIIALSFAGYSQCTIDPNLTQIGFYPPPDSLDCIEKTVAYNGDIQFVTPATFDTFGLTLAIDTIAVSSISGMPGGISYACNPSTCKILGGQNGCVNFSGTTTDAAGQYPLTITVDVTFTIPGLGQQTQSLDLSALGITYYLEVIEQGAGCRTALTVSISGNSTFCPGDFTTLTADAANSSGTVSYMWSPNGEMTQSISASSADTYSVTVSDQNGSATASVDVTEGVLPVAGFTFTVSGQNGAFTNTSTDAVSYLWDFGDGSNPSTLENPSHAFSSVNTYTVSLEATNSCGTDNTSQQVTIQTLSACTPDTVNRGSGVFPAPDVVPCIERGVPYDFTMQTANFDSFTLTIAGLGSFNVPVTSTIIDSVTNFPCGISAQWDKPIYATGEKGCIYVAGTSKEVVGQYPVRIYLTMTLDVPFLGSQTISGELNTELIPQLEQLAGPLGYDFKYVSRVIESGSSCPARDTTSTENTSGLVCPSLAVDIDGNSVICSGTPTTLTATPKYQTGSVTYSWSNGATTQSISTSTAGTYSVSVADQSDNASSSVTVTIGQTPTAGFTATTNRAVATITQNSSTGSPTNYSWNWGDNSAPVTGQIPPPHTYTSNGAFTITLTATNNCGSDQAIQIINTTGVFIQPVENNLDFEVYPNPSSGYFNITLHNNNGAKPVMLRVFDLSGKMIHSENISDLSSTIKKQLDLSSMPKGVYTLHLSSEAGNGIQRLSIY